MNLDRKQRRKLERERKQEACRQRIRLEKAAPALLKALKDLIREPLEIADKGIVGGRTYAFRTSRERWDAAKDAIAQAE